MLKWFAALSICTTVCTPAIAAIVYGGPADLSTGPITFGPVAADSFTLSYSPSGSFDPSPVYISTMGTAAVSSFFGKPSVFFTDGRGSDVIFPDSGPAFSSFPTATAIPYSLTDSFLGLTYSVGADSYYGFAQFAGPNLERYAFETLANTPINANLVTAGVPELSTWAMMLIGFAGFGFAGYRTSRRNNAAAA